MHNYTKVEVNEYDKNYILGTFIFSFLLSPMQCLKSSLFLPTHTSRMLHHEQSLSPLHSSSCSNNSQYIPEFVVVSFDIVTFLSVTVGLLVWLCHLVISTCLLDDTVGALLIVFVTFLSLCKFEFLLGTTWKEEGKSSHQFQHMEQYNSVLN